MNDKSSNNLIASLVAVVVLVGGAWYGWWTYFEHTVSRTLISLVKENVPNDRCNVEVETLGVDNSTPFATLRHGEAVLRIGTEIVQSDFQVTGGCFGKCSISIDGLTIAKLRLSTSNCQASPSSSDESASGDSGAADSNEHDDSDSFASTVSAANNKTTDTASTSETSTRPSQAVQLERARQVAQRSGLLAMSKDLADLRSPVITAPDSPNWQPPTDDASATDSSNVPSDNPTDSDTDTEKNANALEQEHTADMRAQLNSGDPARLAAARRLDQQAWASKIAAVVRSHWIRPQQTLASKIADKMLGRGVSPMNSLDDLQCKVEVEMLPNGKVVSVKVVESSGNSELDASVKEAVLRSDPLPLPSSPNDFDHKLTLNFQPDSPLN